MTDEEERYTLAEIELALEKAYRRGFHQALTLLATFYPHGIGHSELVRIANEHLLWRRELPPSRITDSATPHYADAISPLERQLRGK